MEENESRWVMWEFKWIFLLAAGVALLNVLVGIDQEGAVSAMVFSGVFLLFAVGFSLIWSWRIYSGRTEGSLWQPVVIVGGVGIGGYVVIAWVAGEWTALLNAVIIAVLMGALGWSLRKNPLWKASAEQKKNSKS